MTLPMFAAEHIEIGEATRDWWCTPQWLVDLLVEFFEARGKVIDLDPCSNQLSLVPARRRLMLADDGLGSDWGDARAVYCNPPYSDPSPWVEKCWQHRERVGGDVVGCIKSDTSTEWWHSSIWRRADAVLFPARRVEFVPPPGIEASTPNFPVALPLWGDGRLAFAKVFHGVGKVVLL